VVCVNLYRLFTVHPIWRIVAVTNIVLLSRVIEHLSHKTTHTENDKCWSILLNTGVQEGRLLMAGRHWFSQNEVSTSKIFIFVFIYFIFNILFIIYLILFVLILFIYFIFIIYCLRLLFYFIYLFYFIFRLIPLASPGTTFDTVSLKTS
jgi:hypothetical protein